MPKFLQGLSAFGQGMQQGNAAGADLRQKMMQIQQMQQMLDQAKKTVAAQAAYGNALGSGGPPSGPSGAPGGAPAPTPMPSGAPTPQQQSPWSMAPPPGPGGVPTPTPKPPMPMQPQQPAQPMGGAPHGGMAGPPGGMPSPAPPQGPQGANPLQQLTQALNSGSMDPANAIQAIATKIKTANPGIDPQTLTMAVEQAVSLMHQVGLDPQTKLAMQLMLQNQKGDQRMEQIGAQQEGATGRTELQQEGADKRVGEQQAGATGRTELQQAGATQRTGMTQSGAAARQTQRIADLDQRTKFVQGEISKRAASSAGNRVQAQAQTQRLRAIMGEITVAKAEQAQAANAPTPDQAKIDAANKKLDAAEAKLKILENAVKQPGQASAPRGVTTNKINSDPLGLGASP